MINVLYEYLLINWNVVIKSLMWIIVFVWIFIIFLLDIEGVVVVVVVVFK